MMSDNCNPDSYRAIADEIWLRKRSPLNSFRIESSEELSVSFFPPHPSPSGRMKELRGGTVLKRDHLVEGLSGCPISEDFRLTAVPDVRIERIEYLGAQPFQS